MKTRRRSTERPARKRRSDGERSRNAILREAAQLATVEGISGLSIGRLADAVGMSKSGLFAHFGSKEELQLATIEARQRDLQRAGDRAGAGRADRRSSGCAGSPTATCATSRPPLPGRLLLRLDRGRDGHPSRARARPRVVFMADWLELLERRSATPRPRARSIPASSRHSSPSRSRPPCCSRTRSS